MKTIITVAMKDPAHAKTRLSSTFNPASRRKLALGLFDRALSFFSRAYPEHELAVVTASTLIAQHARLYGALVIREHAEAGLNEAAGLAVDYAIRHGYERVAIVPGDIPIWLREEVDQLLARARRFECVVAQAHDGGTNMLILSPPRRLDFCYGAQSASRYEALAKSLGMSCTRGLLPFISRDIDTVEDCLLLGRRDDAARHHIEAKTEEGHA
jgi:2-phospho-L-lactate/phosphoenolpyruvate guanylyltransferase